MTTETLFSTFRISTACTIPLERPLEISEINALTKGGLKKLLVLVEIPVCELITHTLEWLHDAILEMVCPRTVEKSDIESLEFGIAGSNYRGLSATGYGSIFLEVAIDVHWFFENDKESK